MLVSGVIERGGALHFKLHASTDHGDSADHLVVSVTIRQFSHRHEVYDLTNPIGGKKSSDQDVGLRPVKLLVRDPLV